VGAKSVRGVIEYSLGLRRLCSDSGEDGCPYLEYAIHEGDRSVVCRVVWVGVFGLYISFVALMHHFLVV